MRAFTMMIRSNDPQPLLPPCRCAPPGAPRRSRTIQLQSTAPNVGSADSAPAAEATRQRQTRRRPARPNLFQSFFLGGFECSTHYRSQGGLRLDVNRATGHDRFAAEDFAALQAHGIRTVRDGIRWHRIEKTPGQYTFADDLPLVHAAIATGTQVIWDLCHYGWPDDTDPFRAAFGKRLARMSRAFVSLLFEEGVASPFVVPINEISFLSWIGGTEGKFPPFAINRGDELKRALVQASIETIEAVWEVAPRARICLIDPMINVVGHPDNLEDCRNAERYRLSQYVAWDMIAGRIAPELGGKAEYLDVIGVNYYIHNQWLHRGNGKYCRMLRPADPGYRPVADMLAEIYARYQRPLFIAETGIEARRRASWLRNICGQVAAAIHAGVPMEGICLYPVTDYPGWLDDRHCPTGLLGYPDEHGCRPVCRPLADELKRQQALFANLRACSDGRHG